MLDLWLLSMGESNDDRVERLTLHDDRMARACLFEVVSHWSKVCERVERGGMERREEVHKRGEEKRGEKNENERIRASAMFSEGIINQ